MKRRNFIVGTLLAGLTATPLFARGGRRGGRRGGNGGNTGGNTTPTITEAQKAEILYIYQEEKVARDTYITLGNIYTSENTFARIQESEQSHIDSVEKLCIKYGVNIEGVNEEEVGNFVLPELQEMYDTLVAKGQESLIDALEVGVEIEVKDIKDLEDSIAEFEGFTDVTNVFNNLKDGSENHLRAFQNALSRATA